jgi:uncharacterized membrane protein YkoI
MKTLIHLLAAAALTATVTPALSAAQNGSSFTADQARNARDKGDVLPLSQIFRRLEARYGGYQIDAKLFPRERGPVYEIDWQTGKGERIRLKVDAKTGRILSKS